MYDVSIAILVDDASADWQYRYLRHIINLTYQNDQC